MTAVSVIIPTHNRRDLLLGTVHALRDQDYRDGPFEIVVAPDRCSDGTLEAINEKSLEVTVAIAQDGGKAAALNAGIALARGDVAVFLDDDMLPDRDFVSAHVNAHRGNTNAGLAVTGYSPVALTTEADELMRIAARRFEEFHRKLAEPAHRFAPTDLNGANFSIRLNGIRSVGGFNESYFFQRDDFELATRLIEAGFTIAYCGDARAVQRITVTPKELIGRASPRAQNDLRLAADHPWCVLHLPFHKALKDPGTRLRWRILWQAGANTHKALDWAGGEYSGSYRLVNLAYTAKYVATLRETVDDWDALLELAQVRN